MQNLGTENGAQGTGYFHLLSEPPREHGRQGFGGRETYLVPIPSGMQADLWGIKWNTGDYMNLTTGECAQLESLTMNWGTGVSSGCPWCPWTSLNIGRAQVVPFW
jgi:hypothetical protein